MVVFAVQKILHGDDVWIDLLRKGVGQRMNPPRNLPQPAVADDEQVDVTLRRRVSGGNGPEDEHKGRTAIRKCSAQQRLPADRLAHQFA